MYSIESSTLQEMKGVDGKPVCLMLMVVVHNRCSGAEEERLLSAVVLSSVRFATVGGSVVPVDIPACRVLASCPIQIYENNDANTHMRRDPTILSPDLILPSFLQPNLHTCIPPIAQITVFLHAANTQASLPSSLSPHTA